MTDTAPGYTHVFSVEARAEYQGLSPQDQALVERAIGLLEKDPYPDKGTAPEGPDARRAFINGDLSLRYGVHRHHLVIAEINGRADRDFLFGGDR
ncbi:hypothetical protein HUT18_10800 [Streptomyces sp. NA04227]|uniref:hypothetical protein n=1 Tax=Streptomyces sp. NA04227 TaxID=2742136 RepID=UPI0015905B2E|nr:hypothetical protein [Streptomyces sp. NA04227]QKW06810.1 hypothetical protein HUT18_10800 [Streptomyces sp. NA04227]